MASLALLLIACWIAVSAGRTLWERLHLPTVAPTECFAYCAALGLGVAAYGVYGLGVCGLLTFWPITIWWLFLAVLGIPGMFSFFRDLRNIKRSFKSATNVEASIRWLIAASGLTLIVFGLISLFACFRPPGPLEWDALAYHLADPKLFLMQHRIVSLPTEHHSNFPFTLEMLFTVGLLYNGFALANLFHWLMAALTILGFIGFCGRVLHPLVGWLAGVAFLTTPIVLWEASTAYIDLGLALYVTLSVCASVSALQSQKQSMTLMQDALKPQATSQKPEMWFALAGAMMGFALGMKYLALVSFGLVGLLLLIRRVSLRHFVLYVGVAMAIGSPWYIKNLVTLSNPVYPFLYQVFPHSKYWNAPRAADYQREQDKFGTKPLSKDARSKILNLMSVPWHVLVQSRDRILYCNSGEFTFTALYGGLYAALILPLAFLRRIPQTIRWLLWLALAQIVAWFFLSQVGRYLIQIMPLLAIVGAYTAIRWAYPTAEFQKTEHIKNKSDVSFWQRLPGHVAIAAIFGQAAYVLLSVCTLPLNASGREQMALLQLGQMPRSPFLRCSPIWDSRERGKKTSAVISMRIA